MFGQDMLVGWLEGNAILVKAKYPVTSNTLFFRRNEMRITRQKIRMAMIRGSEVAFMEAAKNGTYHEGPWKTAEQLWYDMQAIERESEIPLTFPWPVVY